MAVSMQQRRDTAANWTSVNPTPLQGQICLVVNGGGTITNMKIGDGITAWASLPYFVPVDSGIKYLGTWNASTNTPTIVSGTPSGEAGMGGNYYIVAVAGSTSIDGVSDWEIGDWIIFNTGNDTWQKIDQSNTVTSVFGRTGAVVGAAGDYDTADLDYPDAFTIGSPTGLDTFQGIFNHEYSSGITDGCNLTDNGNGTISLSSGQALLRSAAQEDAPIYAVEVNAQTPINLVDNTTNYVCLDYNGGSPHFVVYTSENDFNCLDKCLAYVVHRSGTTLSHIDARGQNVDGNRKSRKLFLSFQRFIHAENGSHLGGTNTAVTVTAGRFYFMLNELTHTAFDTSVAGTANANVFKLWYRNGSGGYTGTTNQKTVTTTTYDNNSGTPATLGNNKYGVTWFYIVHNDPSSLHAVMGQAEYSDQASAHAATPPTQIPGLLTGMSSLLGFVVYAKSAASFAEVRSAFGATFSSTAATNHNNLAGLQGGSINDYNHLTVAQVALVNGVDGKTPMTGFPTDASGNYLCTLTYNETTRTVTVAPTGASFDIFANGTKYTKTSTSQAHADTQGGHFIYFDQSGVLTYSTTAWDILLHVPIAYVFWDATNNRGICLDERHHAGRDIYWHLNQHLAEGTKAISGFGVSGYTLSNGATDAAVTWAVATGVVADEDIKITTAALPDDGPYTIMERVGTGGWQITRTSVRPFLDNGTALQYNQNNGGTWQRTAVPEDNFVNYYVMACTSIPTADYTPQPTTTQQIIIFPGQVVYTTEAAASSESVGNVSWGDIPLAEMTPLYQITMRYNATGAGAYTNTARCAVVRFSRIIGTNVSITQTAQVDHGALAGLADDDHTQYLLADGSRAVTGQLSFNTSPLLKATSSTEGGEILFERPSSSAFAGAVSIDLQTNYIRIFENGGTFRGLVADITTCGSQSALWHSGNDGAGSGLDADLLDGQHATAFATSGHTHAGTYQPVGSYEVTTNKWAPNGYAGVDAAGLLLSAKMPTRLGEYAETVTDWDNAVLNGWYMGQDATNAPATGWFLGYVEAHNSLWCTQTVHGFSSDSPADTKTYRREKNNGVWNAWWRVRLTESEQATVFGQLGAANTWTGTNYYSSRVGIGTSPLTNSQLVLGGTYASAGGGSHAMVADGIMPNTSTAAGIVFYANPKTQAASFTCPALIYFSADQGAFGAGSVVNNQYGFIANSSLTGATNNYGFYSNIATGAGRWNFYAGGTASNYFGGPVAISLSGAVGALSCTSPLTASPANLDVMEFAKFNAATAAVGLTLGGTDPRFLTLTVGTDNAALLRANRVGLYATDYIPLYTGSVERMRINSSGDVKIGDYVTGGLASVTGVDLLVSGVDDPLVAIVDNAEGSLMFGVYNGDAFVGRDGTGSLYFKTGCTYNNVASGTVRMTIANDGQVSIGNAFSVTNGAAPAAVNLATDAGYNRLVKFYSGAALRWSMGVDNGAESGSDAGSTFNLYSYTDAGVYKATPVNINRATSTVTLSGLLNLSAGQIKFPATQNASADVNTLDDYEEGTFTPVIAGTSTAGAGTYSHNAGNYTKIGNTVRFSLRLIWSAHTGTGNMEITGLPYANSSATGSDHAVTVGYASNIALTSGNILTALILASYQKITLYQTPTGGGAATLVPIDTAGDLILSGSYIVS